jgi:phage tail protein X
MSGSVETVTVTSEGMTLSKMIWRRFKRPMPGLVEKTLAYAPNRGLAKLGVVLPVGTVVYLPIDVLVAAPERTTVRLW